MSGREGWEEGEGGLKGVGGILTDRELMGLID